MSDPPSKPTPEQVARALEEARRMREDYENEQAGVEFDEAVEPEEFDKDDPWTSDRWAEAAIEYRKARGTNGHDSTWGDGQFRKPDEAKPFIGPSVIDFASSLHLPIQPRVWLDRHKLLRKHTAFQLNGDGGIGKTETALQMMIGMCATGTMFNLPVDRGPCLFVSFEEPENEIRWRIDHLCHAFDIPSSSVENLLILDLTHERDPWLFKEKDRQLVTTPVWTWLRKEIGSLKPMFVAMDNKARFFAANQNDAVLGTGYAHHLELTCYDLGTTIMPLAHVSLNQLQSGRGDSGSVAVGAAFRSRMLFGYGDTERKPDEADKGDRKLTVMKANASPTGYALDFKWHPGLEYFECLYKPPRADDTIGAEERTQRVYKKLLTMRLAQNRPVSSSVRAGNYAPKAFSEHPEREGVNKREFERAQEILFANGTIKEVEYRLQGHPCRKIDFNL